MDMAVDLLVVDTAVDLRAAAVDMAVDRQVAAVDTVVDHRVVVGVGGTD